MESWHYLLGKGCMNLASATGRGQGRIDATATCTCSTDYVTLMCETATFFCRSDAPTHTDMQENMSARLRESRALEHDSCNLAHVFSYISVCFIFSISCFLNLCPQKL